MADPFGNLLRRFRVAASLTQEALADQCRISPATIAAIEQGRRTAPRLSTVRLIADALQLSAADRELLARAADQGAGAQADRQESAGLSSAGMRGAGPVVSPEFIGRREEIAALTALMSRTQAGEPGFALIGGEAGVGKSRLVSELAAGAASQSEFRILTGQCVELGAEGLPLAPLVDALRTLTRGMRPETLAQVLAGRHGPGPAAARAQPRQPARQPARGPAKGAVA